MPRSAVDPEVIALALRPMNFRHSGSQISGHYGLALNMGSVRSSYQHWMGSRTPSETWKPAWYG